VDSNKNKEHNDSLDALIDLIPDPVIAINREGKIVAVNSLVGKFSGFTKECLIGNNFSQLGFVSDEYKLMLAKNSKNRLVGRAIPPYQIRMAIKNGQDRVLEVNGNRICYGGQLLDLAIFHDITEEKSVQAKLQDLRESEIKFQAIGDSAFDGVILFDDKDRIIYWNAAAKRIYGYDQSETLGETLNEKIIPLRLRESHAKHIDNFAKGQPINANRVFRFPALRKDGTEFPSEVSLSSVQIEGKKFTVAIVRDISEREKREKALSESEEKHRRLFEESMDAIILADAETGIIVDCNPAALELVGREKSELIGQHQSIIHPQALIKDGFTEGFKRHLKESTLSHETQVITKTGEIKDVSVKASIFELQRRKLIQGNFRDISERKKAEFALKQERDMLEAITASIGASLSIISRDYKILWANRCFKQLFGEDSEQKTCYKRIYNKDDVCSFCGAAKVFKGAERDEQEFSRIDKAGGMFTMQEIATPIRDENGRVIAALELAIPITERKQIEIKLAEAEKRYHALFDESPLGVVVVDSETTSLVEFNDVACKQLGYSREEFKTLTIPDLEAKESIDDVRLHVTKMLKEGGGEFETKHRAKNGEIRNVLVTTKKIELAGKTYLLSIFHDITEIRNVQNALMQSETQYRQLVEHAQEGVWLVDKEYNTTFVNHRMAQMMGYAESEMLGKSLFDFVDQEHVDQARQVLGKYEQGVEGNFEYAFSRKDGSRVYTSIVASQVTDDEGNYLGTLALVADITLRKQMADKLEQYSKHLEELVERRTRQLAEAQAQLVKAERLAAIGELAGMIGHDLRNPLTGIKNAVYFLEKKGTEIPVEQSKAMLKTIDRCVEYSNKIINDLLDYSREIRLEPRESSPRVLLCESLSMVEVPSNVKVVDNLLHKQVLNVDSDKIKRVFVNLIKNAIDAMPDGGKLTVDSRVDGDSMAILFADTGLGVPDEVLPRLFSPLFTTKARGMGFGLAICKRIVEAHGGTITVKTVKGKGTTFTVTLPIEPKLEMGGEKVWINMPESLLSTTTKP
jgi:PAS domain S-box-containing protein